MAIGSLTPLKFAPIFKTALWGGFRLRNMLGAQPSDEPTGEAWILSDQGDSHSVVATGPLAGTSLRQLLEQASQRILGPAKTVQGRFPVLLKFLHACQPLSVQVHPTDAKARELEGPSAVGKTEAWVVLEADPSARLYAGLLPRVTPERLRRAIDAGAVEELLHAHAPNASDCLFIQAGTVHAIGGGVVLFEIQQTSDITYRLYDWGRVDPNTGRGRELHVDKGLACVNYLAGPCRPVYPTSEGHGRVRLGPLVDCEYFFVGRWESDRPFRAGIMGHCRVLVGIGGRAVLRHAGQDYRIGVGDVWLLPAEVGAVDCIPNGTVMLLECGLAT
jgi:mannose-6-phosphate isomerase